MCMSSESDHMTHVAANDAWAWLKPCEEDIVVDGDKSYAIVRKYAAFIGRDIDADMVVVSHPDMGIEDDEDCDVYEGNGFTLSFTDGTEVIDDYRFDEPCEPSDGWIKLECSLGTAVYETFEQLCEEHPACIEASEWYSSNEFDDDFFILMDDVARELCIATTRDEAGRHFTEWMKHYEKLERLGLIKINRPVHSGTGISYDCQYWTLEVTDEGQEFVDANPELHPS